jgi:hypothetical protein
MDRTLKFEKALTGKKILVTGSTGFTGGWPACGCTPSAQPCAVFR